MRTAAGEKMPENGARLIFVAGKGVRLGEFIRQPHDAVQKLAHTSILNRTKWISSIRAWVGGDPVDNHHARRIKKPILIADSQVETP